MPKLTKKLLGHCVVDSSQLTIVEMLPTIGDGLYPVYVMVDETGNPRKLIVELT